MGDIARCSLGAPGDFYNEDLLYKMFGVNAELLIDHAWGWEPCTIAQIHAYRPRSSSLGSGQVLTRPYSCSEARIVAREMAEHLALDLVDDRKTTDQMVLTIGYDVENLKRPVNGKLYRGPVVTDGYGRKIPAHAHGSESLHGQTSSSEAIVSAVIRLFDRIADPDLTIRRLTITAEHTQPESVTEEQRRKAAAQPVQLSLFDTAAGDDKHRQDQEEANRLEEKHLQDAVLKIQKKYGKNAVLKGTSFQDGATQRERNGQIGGHKA